MHIFAPTIAADQTDPSPPKRSSPRSRTVQTVALVVVAGLAGLIAPATADAGTPLPAKLTHVRVAVVSGSSFTVVAAKSVHAQKYRLYASTSKRAVFFANVASAPRSALNRLPRVTLTGLAFTAAPYYYRIAAINGSRVRYSSIKAVSLRPAVPTGVRITNNAAGTFLTWSSASATGFAITQATDAAQTRNRRLYRVRGQGHQFTPYGLVKGTTYYFRVRALNGASHSAYSAQVQAAPLSTEQGVRVMTYNLREATGDGQRVGTETIAPWAQRRFGVAKLIRETLPDVVDIQEGAAWTGAVKGPRQVDSLVSTLGGQYALASTEVPPSQAHYFRTGNYVLYKVNSYRAVGRGGHWTLPYGSTAAYQVLQNHSTGARFVSVSPHLVVGAHAVNDARRQAQTTSLLSQAGAYAAARHLPVIYGGDFNSDINRNHAFDGPGVAMRAAHAADAQDAAQYLHNQRYNSANQFQRIPVALGQNIDHIYAPAGVAVRSWQLGLDLVNGHFVGPIPSDHNPLVCDLSFRYLTH